MLVPLALLSALFCLLLFLASGAWLVVAGFKVHALWGIGMLLFPPVNFLFAFMHWKEARSPFLWNLISFTAAVALLFYGLTQSGIDPQALWEEMQRTSKELGIELKVWP